MSDLVLDLHDVTKTYRGKVRALRGIDMQVHRGEVFGLLGPNGAGKSTLVKILMTVIRPTSVEGTMLGEPVGHKPTLARVGYLPEHHTFPPYLTGAQVLDFVGALAKVPRTERRERIDSLLQKVGMSEWAHKRIGKYSKGMRQRIGVAQALVNDPDIILLDEPTDGVDPVGRRDIRKIVVDLKDAGKTIFLNSHLLSELEMVCDRVAILVQGQVAQQGTIDELTRDSRRFRVSVRGEAPTWATDTPGATVEKLNGDARIDVSCETAEELQPLLDRLRSEQFVITSVVQHRESLEDLFMRAVHDPTTGTSLKPGARSDQAKGGAS